jgi:cytosine/adenosine deaminase-related metal-dependent hydrolase
MSSLLIRDLHTLVPMTGAEHSLSGIDVLIENGRIAAIGADLPTDTTSNGEPRIIDGSAHVAYPGFINTHHHLFQTLTRNLPPLQNAKLFDWLIGLYEIWRGLDAEAVEVSTRVGVAELLLSGCTTTSDHLYLFGRQAPAELLDVAIETARKMGARFHPSRGSMSLGRSSGGLPPDDLVQSADEILRDCERVIDRHHDPSPHSMCRVVLAPCSPFSVTPELLRDSALLARERGVHLHTHLCETRDEEEFCLEHFGKRPVAHMAGCGWLGEDVWYAHAIYLNDDEIETLARTGTGVAHCPASNLRLGSGICRVPRLLEAGVNVGLAVDGSASNDASGMVREMQLALLVHREGTAVDAMPPENVLTMATTGSAAVLGRSELGRLEPGAAADLALFRLDRVDFAGAMHDPASALLFCGSGVRADYTIVAGEVRVDRGELVGVDERRLFHRANEVARRLVERAG